MPPDFWFSATPDIPYQSLKIAGYPGIKYFSTAAIAPCELCTLYRVGPQWMQRVPAVVPRGLLLTPPQVYSCQHQSAQVSSVGLKTVILCPFCEKKIDKLRHVQDGKNAVHIKTIISGKIRIFFHTALMVHSGGGGWYRYLGTVGNFVSGSLLFHILGNKL